MLPEAKRKEEKYPYLSPYFCPSITFQYLLLVKSAGSQETQWEWGSDRAERKVGRGGESKKDAEDSGLGPRHASLDNLSQGSPPDNANCPGGAH